MPAQASLCWILLHAAYAHNCKGCCYVINPITCSYYSLHRKCLIYIVHKYYSYITIKYYGKLANRNTITLFYFYSNRTVTLTSRNTCLIPCSVKNCNTPNLLTYTLQIVLAVTWLRKNISDLFIIAWFAVVFGINCSRDVGRKQ